MDVDGHTIFENFAQQTPNPRWGSGFWSHEKELVEKARM